MHYKKETITNALDFKVFVLTTLRYALGTNARATIISNNEVVGVLLMDSVQAFNDNMVAIMCMDREDQSCMAPIMIPGDDINIANVILNSFIAHIEDYLEFDMDESIINIMYHDIITYKYDMKTQKARLMKPSATQLMEIKYEIKELISSIDEDEDDYCV